MGISILDFRFEIGELVRQLASTRARVEYPYIVKSLIVLDAWGARNREYP